MTIRFTSADATKHVIASTILRSSGDPSPLSLGGITLRPHQADAANRLSAMVGRNGGAMLAEPVGLGKTFTALAVAARLGARRIVGVIPASLQSMWLGALDAAGVHATLITHESLSRGGETPTDADLVIVDESHRFRNPNTHRYAAAAALCARSRVLLLSATPIQNKRNDLAAQLALYLGRLAWSLLEDALAVHVVRGTATRAPTMPRVAGPYVVALDFDEDCVDQLLTLPSPIPARDETMAVALLTYGLVHQWSSSRAALVTALDRRAARALALESGLEAGRHPTRTELAAWTWAGDAVQLAFPEIVAQQRADDDLPQAELLQAVRAYRQAVESLISRLRATPDPDDRRGEALREIRRRHTGERVIAFCHYAETVRALWARLGRDPGVAALTASAARVASGRVSRESVLRQFDPANRHDTRRAERIDLLVATDVLSEGLNLHEASVVVHLDQPWNPARLDQRVGRVRRLGSRHSVVTIYSVAPPASADRMLRVSDRLREKLRVAQRTIGVAGHIMPALPASEPPSADDAPSASNDQGASERASDIRDRLRHWILEPDKAPGCTVASDEVLIAAVSSLSNGWIALIETDDDAFLVADLGRGPETKTAAILAAIDKAGTAHRAHDEEAVRSAIRAVQSWLESRRAAATVDLPGATSSPSRRLALNRVARALSRTPRHRRALIAPLVTAARSVATAPLAEGAERVLDTLVDADLPDEAWLRSIAAFGELHARPESPSGTSNRSRVRAILLLVKESD
jgi:superfamily II DNA or RNA helicase